MLVLLGGVAITHGLNCARRPFNVPYPLGYGVRAVYVALGTFAMVWPAFLPRVGAVLVATGLVASQTWMPRFRDVGTVATGEYE